MIHLEKNGKLTLPETVIRKLGWKEGEKLMYCLEGGKLQLYPPFYTVNRFLSDVLAGFLWKRMGKLL